MRAQLYKVNPRCNRCKLRMPIRGLTVDHIKPIWMGGGGSRDGNLQLLCRKCHAKKNLIEARVRNELGLDIDPLYGIRFPERAAILIAGGKKVSKTWRGEGKRSEEKPWRLSSWHSEARGRYRLYRRLVRLLTRAAS